MEEIATKKIKIDNNISVDVEPIYLEEESYPEDDLYVWMYCINISNSTDTKVQLLSRHWKIIDANGLVRTVEGEGVVGEQPVIKPRDSFEYISGVSLNTSMGWMEGSYLMNSEKKKEFLVDIPAFSLSSEKDKICMN